MFQGIDVLRAVLQYSKDQPLLLVGCPRRIKSVIDFFLDDRHGVKPMTYEGCDQGRLRRSTVWLTQPVSVTAELDTEVSVSMPQSSNWQLPRANSNDHAKL